MVRSPTFLLLVMGLLAGCGSTEGPGWAARGTYDAHAAEAALSDAKRVDAEQPRATAMQLPTVAEAQQPANARLREAQDILRQNGLYDGPLDGLPSARTQAAIKAWQDQHRLAVTGRLDAATYASLKGAGG